MISDDLFTQRVTALTHSPNPARLIPFLLAHPQQVARHVDFCARSFQHLPSAAFSDEVVAKTQQLFWEMPSLREASYDGALQVEQHRFSLHRNLAAAQSPALSALFSQGNTGWGDLPILLSKEVSPEAVQHIVDFIETGATTFSSVVSLITTFRQAVAWDLHHVALECERLILRLMTTENALNIWKFALSAQHPHLLFTVANYISRYLPIDSHMAWAGPPDSLPSEFLALGAQGVQLIPTSIYGIRVEMERGTEEALSAACSLLGKAGVREVSFENVSLSTKSMATLQKALSSFSRLESLDLSQCHLTEDSGKILSQILRAHSSLKVLILANNQLGSSGASHLADGVAHHPSLVRLDLSKNRINGRGGKKIASAAARAPRLEELYLSGNPLGVEALEEFAPPKGQTSSLRELHLSECAVGNHGSKALRILTTSLSRLELLDLSRNGLGETSVKGLLQGKAPQALKLGGNAFSSKALSDLCGFLEKNPQLRHLDLSHTRLDAQSTRSLTELITHHPHLQRLTLQNIASETPAAFARQLGTALKSSESLEHLDLANTPLQLEGFLNLAEGLLLNKSLHTLVMANCLLHLSSANQELADLPTKVGTVDQILRRLKEETALQIWW